MNDVASHLKSIKVNDEYGTPPKLYFEVCSKYNIYPVLDVACSCTNRVCIDGFIKADQALDQEWNRDFFMNPPYSQIYPFMKKAYEQHIKHNVNALILIYSKTDTKYWHNFVTDKVTQIHFQKGRIEFLDSTGAPTGDNAPYPSAWLIYRAHPESDPLEHR